LTDSLPLDGGKVVMGENKIRILYAKRNQSKPGQRVIDVIKEYGEFIPLMKGKMISASQLLERFLLMLKQYDFVDRLSGGELKRLYLCTV
jgi:ATP-binding cassette subfamily F protein uup